jgi:hypothetical protein
VERLIDNRREKAESLRAEKVRKENDRYTQYCTFQPAISCESKRLASKEAKSVRLAHERLYE